MRDLLFKNLTSSDKKRKIISTSETVEKQGVRSIIRRSFICMVREIKDGNIERPLPYLYVLKVHNTKEGKERFFCRLKGSVLMSFKQKLFLILFMHSLKIDLTAVSQDAFKFSGSDAA